MLTWLLAEPGHDLVVGSRRGVVGAVGFVERHPVVLVRVTRIESTVWLISLVIVFGSALRAPVPRSLVGCA
jgi:hypothetical protein